MLFAKARILPFYPVCRLPMDPGPCRAELHKYFFDPSIGQCREFVYGGCRGNANKFSSMEECESTCHELIKKVVGKLTILLLIWLRYLYFIFFYPLTVISSFVADTHVSMGFTGTLNINFFSDHLFIIALM